MADPKKLRALLDTQAYAYPGTGTDYMRAVHDMTKHDDPAEPLPSDDMSEEGQIARKVGAGYMEIREDAGGFSCGACRYAAPGPSEEEASCMHAQIRAQVSAMHGCCNLFWPLEGPVVFPDGAMPPEEREPDFEEEEEEEGSEQAEGAGEG